MRRITYATAKELHNEAVALGLPLTYTIVRKRTYFETDDVIRARFREEVLFRSMVGAYGVDPTLKEGSNALSRNDWDGRRAAEAIIGRVVARKERLAKACTVRVRSSDFERGCQTAALCGCARCETWLVERLRPWIGAMVMARSWTAALELDEIKQEGAISIGRALDSWDPDGGTFMSFFPRLFECRMIEMLRYASTLGRRAEAAAVPLDAPIVGGGNRARYVTYADRIPDRSIDVASIVVIRERVWEIVNARRAELAAAA